MDETSAETDEVSADRRCFGRAGRFIGQWTRYRSCRTLYRPLYDISVDWDDIPAAGRGIGHDERYIGQWTIFRSGWAIHRSMGDKSVTTDEESANVRYLGQDGRFFVHCTRYRPYRPNNRPIYEISARPAAISAKMDDTSATLPKHRPDIDETSARRPKARSQGALVLQKPALGRYPGRVADKSAVRPHHPVAGDDDGDGVMAHRAAHGLG